jgi:phosphatidylinositol glycan class B
MLSVSFWRALIVDHPRRLFCYAFALRCIHALLVSTYFNPDEFWQSLEVAHNMVFGTGFLTWEWQPHARIRSAAHPAIFAIYYWTLKLLGIDSAMLVVCSVFVFCEFAAVIYIQIFPHRHKDLV